MPELPEVETMRRGILGIQGGRIEEVGCPPCALRPITIEPRLPTLRKRLLGRRVAAVERIGKRVVLRLDDEARLVFEPRMTGLLLLAQAPDNAHLRFYLEFRGARQRKLWFWDRRGLGVVRWLAANAWEAVLGASRIGPDAIQMSVADWGERLGASRRAIKVALLDQKAVAGIGNLYAAELLHLARIDPRARCDQLRPADWKRLHEAAQEVLLAAIEHEGSTLSDATYRNALNRDGGYQNLHRVYQKTGAPCESCGRGPIQRIVQAQRATFFCPSCQMVPSVGKRTTGSGRRLGL